VRFHANDNIAAFIKEGELEQLQAEVQSKLAAVLESLVIDVESDHNTQDTAKRVAKTQRSLQGPLPGRAAGDRVSQHRAPQRADDRRPDHGAQRLLAPPVPDHGQGVGGVMPNEHSNLIGLSKYARLLEWMMSRPQIQEEAVSQAADLLMQKLQPDGLAIVMEADHFCMHWRGVKDVESKMINSVMRGSFLRDANLRREFLALISQRQRG
jgi:GTP cyclohydrolase I